MAASSCAVSHCSPAPALPALPRAPIAPAPTLRGLPTEAGGGIASSLHPSEPLRGPSQFTIVFLGPCEVLGTEWHLLICATLSHLPFTFRRL